jgi:hypothetical protein
MDRLEYNAYQREYQKKRYARRMTEAREALGGRCSCGSTDRLQLDHVDPAMKTMTIADMTRLGDERFWAEVRKCQLLCFDCHVAKSKLDLSVMAKARQPGHHGISHYNKHGCRCPICSAAKAASRKAPAW